METPQTELEKKAWIEREMESLADCDVFIKKRDGVIVYSTVKPISKEIRMTFGLIFND